MGTMAVVLGLFLLTGPLAAQDAPYVGLWSLKSSGGYAGTIALDTLGGCSYSIYSSALSIQATCIIRELSDGTLMIFGTQDGTSSVMPIYGDQTGSSNQQKEATVNFSIFVSEMRSKLMMGQLIVSGVTEDVRLTR